MDAPPQRQHHGLTPHERFERWFVKDPDRGCWLWIGSLNNGYGQFNLDGKQMILAHRAAWRLYVGHIPRNPGAAYGTMFVCHHCDEPRCVNPDHLYLGTAQTNMDDMARRQRANHPGLKGSKHGQAKLTEEQVSMIRQSPERGSVLAKEFGVSRTIIYDIRAGKIWRHEPTPVDQTHTALPVWNKGVAREVWAPKKKDPSDDQP